MTPDPDLGPPEYQPDEEPSDDDAALFAAASYELDGWEYIEQQREQEDAEPEPWRTNSFWNWDGSDA